MAEDNGTSSTTSTTDGSAETDTGATDANATSSTTDSGEATLAEIKALADELGITPGQLKGRLEASKKWETRAKQNGTAAQTATDLANATKAQLAEVAKILGLAPDEATPEKLQSQLSEREQQIAQRDEVLAGMLREREAEKAARAHKADVDLLMPALAYNGVLDDLDPSADDFASTVNKVVGDFVQKNPKFLAAASFPDLRQGNQGGGAAASHDPNAWLRHMAGRS